MSSIEKVNVYTALPTLAGRAGVSSTSRTIQPNQSVGLCFGSPATVPDDSRLDSALAGGEMIENGTLYVGQ